MRVLGKPIADPSIQWLLSPDTALLSLIIMTSWATIGYDMVVFLAALQGIPNHLYEAATVDGSSRWIPFTQNCCADDDPHHLLHNGYQYGQFSTNIL